MERKKLRLGLPKGSLQEATFSLFRNAGIRINAADRSYFPVSDDDDLEIRLIRAQELPGYVEDGVLDAALTGYDWIRETGAKVEEICELCYAKSGFRPVRWVLCVSKFSRFKTVNSLKGKRIATELVNVTKEYFRKKKVPVRIEFSWGATEAKVPDLADGIVELTETGSSLRANNLLVIDEVLKSTTRLISNKKSLNNPWIREKLDNLSILLNAAITASGMVGLKLNIEKRNLNKILLLLPALRKPTISALTDQGWSALEVVLEEKTVKKILPALKKNGASGIIEYPLNKLIL